jgi:hypothetical protein
MSATAPAQRRFWPVRLPYQPPPGITLRDRPRPPLDEPYPPICTCGYLGTASRRTAQIWALCAAGQACQCPLKQPMNRSAACTDLARANTILATDFVVVGPGSQSGIADVDLAALRDIMARTLAALWPGLHVDGPRHEALPRPAGGMGW